MANPTQAAVEATPPNLDVPLPQPEVAATPQAAPEPRPSLDVVVEEMEKLRVTQAGTIEALDAKAGSALGFTGTILAMFVALQDIEQLTPVGLGGVLALGHAVWIFHEALKPRAWEFAPNPKELQKYMDRPRDLPTTGAKEQILKDKMDAYYHNVPLLDEKAKQVERAVKILAIGIMLLTAHVVWRKIVPTNFQEKETTSAPPPPATPNPNASNIIKKGQS